MGTSAVLDIALWGSLALSFIGIVGMLLVYRRSAQPAKPIRSHTSEAGNIFFALFGAVALIAILGGATMSFMKGPLATSVKLTKMNSAETQMSVGAQIAVMASANQSNNGDCDLDGFVEPIEWRAATTEPIPAGGGLIPMTVGISKKDPWGTEYGYCVWNHGTITSGSGCNANLLAGTNSKAYQVASLVSAGPDKAFTTTCRTFATADVNSDGDLLDAGDLALISKAAETDDDIIFSYTYDEATGASGGLWSIKSGDPNTAVINKDIETTGTANLQGGLLLPDTSLITCDASNAGVMAMNGNAIEICDGTAWTAITGGVAGGGLVLTPNVSSGMNVTGGCGTATCYSSNVTFTLTNNLSPAASSVVLATSLSNTTNFEFVSDGCNGLSLAAGASCQIVVRAKATGNVSYSGSLQVLGNNSPLATLDGTASGFAGCNAGGMAPGGYYVACGVSGYDLVITPGGCSGGMTNPTCAGGTDTLSLASFGANPYNASPYLQDTVSGDGQINTANLIAYSGGIVSSPMASWCDGLVYGGFDDWFLPSFTQLQNYFYPNRAAVGGFITSGNYASSTTGIDHGWTTHTVSALASTGAGSTIYAPGTSPSAGFIRCMRWTPAKTVTPTVDTTPVALTFSPSYGGPSETRTSNSVTIYSVTQPVSISVSGSGSPQYSKNGGAYTSAAGTVTNGDQITLRATSPALGLESVASVTIGSSSFNWQVRTPGNNTIRVFTTSTAAYTSNLGGVGGADASCTSVANSAGLPGVWVAVANTGGTSVENRLPWNWKTLKNMNNQTVAVSLQDFMDGTISAPMNYGPTGGSSGGSLYWSGLNAAGIGSTAYSCGNFTCTGCGYGQAGDSSMTGGGGYFNAEGPQCNVSRRLLCMESNAAGVDTDPNAVSIRPQVVFSSGGTGTSNTVTITGVTDEVTVTITPSAGTANIIKDGVPVGATTTTAGLNATLAFTLTAPTTLGTKNTATITLGPDTYTWWVGYADSAREAKVFITPQTVSPSMGGLSGADATCASHASSSPYGLSSNWKAMLSSSSVDMADRIPWNWGTLRTVTGNIVADGGYTDLLDGSLDGPINITSNGTTINSTVHTGTNSTGMRLGRTDVGATCTTSLCWTFDWTSNGCSGNAWAVGNSGLVSGQYLDFSWTSCGNWNYMYCIEDIDAAGADTTPNTFNLPYAIQVPASSRQSSASVTISGMSVGATQTLSVSATGGTPRFKVNGGAEVSSGSIKNGDSVVFLMDAPGTDNSSNKMTITAGSMTIYWRVWTGESTGTAIKRVFVTSQNYRGDSIGGVAGADAKCQARAAAAALGGTWKAILSATPEDDWAVNRIGYNWSELRLVDGTTTVSYAGGLWSGSSLISPIIKNETGAVDSSAWVFGNTTSRGFSQTSTNSGENCSNWTTFYPYITFRLGNTAQSASPQWVDNAVYNDPGCGSGNRLYCIEQ